MATFGMRSLQAEKGEPFELSDGTLIYFRRRTSLTKPETQQLLSLSAKAQKFLDTELSEEEQEKLLTEAYGMMNEIIDIILPDLPEADRATCTMFQLLATMEYWKQTEDEAQKKGSKKRGESRT